MTGRSAGPGAPGDRRRRSWMPIALALLGLAAPSLTAQEKAPAAAPLRVGGEVSRPELISKTPPVYTELARKARVQGVVIVEAVIDELGDVTDVKVLKGLPMGLDQAAVEAVKTWKFDPALKDGRPVKVYYSLVVNFQLGDGSPYRGAAFNRFLAQHSDFQKALQDQEYDEAGALLDRWFAERTVDDAGIALARVYLLLERDLLDDAWREAQKSEDDNRQEALLAVVAYAFRDAQRLSGEGALQAIELGLQAADAALAAQPGALAVLKDKSLLLRQKARLAADPAARDSAATEASRIEALLQAQQAGPGRTWSPSPKQL